MNNVQYNKWVLEVSNQEYSGNIKLLLNSFNASSFLKPPVLYEDRGLASKEFHQSFIASRNILMLTPRKDWRVSDSQVSGRSPHSSLYYNKIYGVN